ncbi:hypothetical protein QEN19_000535 [Hanseniaspora menglaensis]
MSSEVTIYDFDLNLASGEILSLSSLKGKIILIVNTASNCSFNQQLVQLQALHEKYSDKLVIIGVPCNQFVSQELLPNEKLVSVYLKEFGVTFPLLERSIINGKKEIPLYKYLKSQKKSLLGFKGIKWNFEKFLVDQTGKVIKRYSTYVVPNTIEKDLVNII